MPIFLLQIRSTVPKMTQIKQILLVVTLTFSLGITWFIGLFLLLDNSSVYQSILNWVFVVLNAFQVCFISVLLHENAMAALYVG